MVDADADADAVGVFVADRIGDGPLLDRVIIRLQEIERSTGLERTLAIGRLIMMHFFGGDPTVWRDRRRNENNSIRGLAERKDWPVSKSALNEAVAIYVASKDLPCIANVARLTARHISAVLTLKVADRQLM